MTLIPFRAQDNVTMFRQPQVKSKLLNPYFNTVALLGILFASLIFIQDCFDHIMSKDNRMGAKIVFIALSLFFIPVCTLNFHGTAFLAKLSGTHVQEEQPKEEKPKMVVLRSSVDTHSNVGTEDIRKYLKKHIMETLGVNAVDVERDDLIKVNGH